LNDKFFFVIDNSMTLWNIFTFCVHFTGEHTKLYYIYTKSCIFSFGATVPSGSGPPHSRGF